MNEFPEDEINITLITPGERSVSIQDTIIEIKIKSEGWKDFREVDIGEVEQREQLRKQILELNKTLVGENQGFVIFDDECIDCGGRLPTPTSKCNCLMNQFL